MPSSSTGSSHQELLIQQHLAQISAHLHYYTTTSIPSIPYLFSPAIKAYESLLPSQLGALFTHLLDAPITIPHFNTDLAHPYAQAFVAATTDLVRLRPAPHAVLDRLSAWLDALGARLEAAGRLAEGLRAAEAGERAWMWREEVREALDEMEREEVRIREGMRGVCLRWGV